LLFLQGEVRNVVEKDCQEYSVDGVIRKLLLAFSAAPALAKLHAQLPYKHRNVRNRISIDSRTLVSVNGVHASIVRSANPCCDSLYS
jgi:hypothetical protein